MRSNEACHEAVMQAEDSEERVEARIQDAQVSRAGDTVSPGERNA